MGYEYDYVFDWMVKKPNAPNNALGAAGKTEEDKQNEGDATAGQNNPGTAGSTGKNQTTQ